MPIFFTLLPPPPSLSLPLSFPSPKLPYRSFHFHQPHNHRLRPPLASSLDASSAELPLFLGPDGVYSVERPRDGRVVVLWDLDNKPPRGPPYDAAVALRRLASSFGSPLHVSAFANRHAFLHVPQWVVENRRLRRERDFLERHSAPSDPYPCSVCGRKFGTHVALRRHFRSLHERERNKKLARMRSLKGKKRIRYRERFISGNTKYEVAERELSSFPRAGYGLSRELRRAGVFVRTVADRPQAADAALKGEMRHWISSKIDWLFLVSDDSDFTEMIQRAREEKTRTVVVGDTRTALGRTADVWVPWAGVESGEIGEEVVRAGGWTWEGLGAASGGGFGGGIGSELDASIEDIIRGRSANGPLHARSAFSEEETDYNFNHDNEDGGDYSDDSDLDWDSEDEEDAF